MLRQVEPEKPLVVNTLVPAANVLLNKPADEAQARGRMPRPS